LSPLRFGAKRLKSLQGRVAERFKAAVLKTARGFTLPRGFESHPFRQSHVCRRLPR
jgi:hypothetical protein